MATVGVPPQVGAVVATGLSVGLAVGDLVSAMMRGLGSGVDSPFTKGARVGFTVGSSVSGRGFPAGEEVGGVEGERVGSSVGQTFVVTHSSSTHCLSSQHSSTVSYRVLPVRSPSALVHPPKISKYHLRSEQAVGAAVPGDSVGDDVSVIGSLGSCSQDGDPVGFVRFWAGRNY